MKIDDNEIKRLAYISRIAIKDDEFGPIKKQLFDVLSYVERVEQCALQDSSESPRKNVNVFREDMTLTSDTQALCIEAPECEENFFVVPRILENN